MPDNPKPLTAEEITRAEQTLALAQHTPWGTPDPITAMCREWMPRALATIRALTERIAALEAENTQREQTRIGTLMRLSRALFACKNLAAHIRGLRKRIAALEADKARLDWLEDRAVEVFDPETGKLIFFRSKGASPLREYVDETAAAFQEPRP